jgi:hypothetical protein
MNMRFKVLMTAVVVMCGAMSASAGDSYLDAGSKARGEFGTSSRMETRSMYRSSAPIIVQRDIAPTRVAQTPSERQSFSYEPSQRVTDSNKAESGTANPPSGMAQRETRTYRSFSYEPSYQPSMRGRSGSQTPVYALPRTDGRKLGGSY